MLFDKQTTLRPNSYPWTKDYIYAMWNGFWNARKFTFDSDLFDFYNTLDEQERQIVVRSLASIAQIEVQVKRFWANLGKNLPQPSIESLGIVMAHVEEIHSDAYEKLLTCLGLSSSIDDILKKKELRDRSLYLSKHNEKEYDDDRKQYIYSIILFTLFTENVSLFSQFYIILWFNKERNVLKDTAQQIKYTRNEETLHFQIGAKLINTLRSEYPEYFDGHLEATIYRACHEACFSEYNLIDMILGEYSLGSLNSTILKNFVKYKLNEGLELIGYKPIYTVDHKEDFFWIEEGIYSTPKVDFFHSEPVSYTQSDISESDDF